MYQYYISAYFKKRLKPYLKKYRSLIDDVIESLKTFDKRTSVALGSNTYKLRVSCRDFPKGKSHAFRMIVLIVEVDYLITPIVLYPKNERTDISREEISVHATQVCKELEERFPMA